MKYSWQRQIILETIQEHKEHLSAQQIYGYARERCPHISLGTVYRNLNTLADKRYDRPRWHDQRCRML